MQLISSKDTYISHFYDISIRPAQDSGINQQPR